MTSLEELSQDNGAFTSAKAQAHLTLLRMLISVYDAFGTMHMHPLTSGVRNPSTSGAMHALASMILNGGPTPEQSQDFTNHYLRVANLRYRLYLDLLVSIRHTPTETWPLPDWDIALMMHTHMLSPLKFAHDISSNPHYSGLTGLLDFPLVKLATIIKQKKRNWQDDPATRMWNARYPTMPYNLVKVTPLNTGPQTYNQSPLTSLIILQPSYHPSRFQFQPPPPFSLDLVEAVKRQIGFARKITAIYPYDSVPHALLADSEERYCKFMNLIRLRATPNPVPAMDIDLFWHTHQVSPSNYLPWCNHHIGRSINHDDTIGEDDLSNGLQETIAAWEANYSEDYLNPSPAAVAQTRMAGISTSDKTPPSGLTPAQLRLWQYDVEHQNKTEEMARRLHHTKRRLAAIDQQIASQPPEPSMSSSSEMGGKRGFMKRLIKVAMSEPSPSQKLLEQRAQFNSSINSQISHAKFMQECWGKIRWPLLVAARGFGDPTITHGEYTRPSQGTNTLNFPIYPATWYDRKPLDYYDYVSGGPEGAGTFEGGGIPLGGAQCGGQFNGGNCTARLSAGNSSSGCGGGCSGG